MIAPPDLRGTEVKAAHWPAVAFAFMAMTAASLILWLGRHTSFWHDDCDFLHHRSLADPLSIFVPHNDHAVALPAVAYRAVADIAGTASYVPFLALVQVAHVATAAGLFAILSARSRWLGLGAAAVFLVLGSGADNLFWAFQITFVGSTAFGVWALWGAERDRWPLAGLLLVGSVFCSLVGVAFVIATAILGLSRRRPGIVWLILPVVTLACWWIFFGLGWERPPDWAVFDYGSPASFDSWMRVPVYLLVAAVRTVAGLSGFSSTVALAVIVAIAAAVAIAFVRGWRPSPFQLAGISGFLVFTVMAGVIRAAGAVDFESRFVYVAATFSLLILPAIRRTPVTITIGILVFASAFGSNLLGLGSGADLWTGRVESVLACQP